MTDTAPRYPDLPDLIRDWGPGSLWSDHETNPLDTAIQVLAVGSSFPEGSCALLTIHAYDPTLGRVPIELAINVEMNPAEIVDLVTALLATLPRP